MRIAVAGDIHGDVAALRRVVARLRRAQPDRVVCLGDVLDCGAPKRAADDLDRPLAQVTDWDTELAELLAGADMLRGNQEERVAELVGSRRVPDACLRLLRAPRRWAAGDVEIVHGHDLAWTRVQDDWYCPLDAPVRRVLLFGHHHRNALYRLGNERTWEAFECPTLHAGTPQRLGESALVNVGPVRGVASWVLVDTEADTVTHHFEPSYTR